ncbi:TadE family protein [Planctomicrobium sp. SH661]|uniref:TadE family protein n=1 Tax=Planctomicrobium sp. SH661 TaxID=3448124 RepID=UPI003F5BD7BD
MRRHFSPVKTDSRPGAVLVETAIVMPVFLVVIWGTMEFGRAMMVGQLATNAARFGARTAILEGSTNSSVTTQVKQYVVDTVKGITVNDVTVEISVTPGTGNQNPNNQLAASKPRDLCKVTVVVPYNKVAYFPPRFLANTKLRGVCAMHHE